MPQLQLALLLAVLCVAALALAGYRPYLEEFRSPLRRFIAGLLFVGILTIAVFLPVASYGEIAKLEAQDFGVVEMLAGHVILIAFIGAWWLLRSDVSLARFLHLSAQDLGSKIGQGVAAGCGGWVLTIMVMFTAVTIVGASDAPAKVTDVPEIIPWMAQLSFPQKLAIVVTAMTVEEAFFRAFLQSRIGLLLSSILFALGHFTYGMPFMIVGVLTISLVIGATFATHDDLLPCMIAHGVFDAVQIFIILPYAVKMMERAQEVPI